MNKILVFGAGKSSSYLIKYLLEKSPKYFWQVTVADANLNAAIERIGKNEFGTAYQLDINQDELRKNLIKNADIIISMLPPALHFMVAHDCLELRKNLITASYVSPEIKSLDKDAKELGLLFMNEMGLDPGIDHMSAMKIIDEVEKLGCEIHSFKSYCGGLVAPVSDDNPWHYKISWNPRNILNAGKSGAEFLLNGDDKKIEYNHLFHEIETVTIPKLGKLAAYANRDSLHYQTIYKLPNIKTLLRATFRYEDFCIGWNAVVNLGLINEYEKFDATNLTYKEWFLQSTKNKKGNTIEEKILFVSNGNKIAYELLYWLGIFSDEKINSLMSISSADILLKRIEEKWKMQEHDKDMIVMHHEFEYNKKNIKTKLTSTLIVEGEDKTYTAMAKTVGLPMAIFTKLLLTNKIQNLIGVQIPVMKEVYKPILKELTSFGIEFSEAFNN